MAANWILPDLSGAKVPEGSQYDFVVGTDGRPGAGGPVATIAVGNVADFITINGIAVQNMNGKISGSTIRLVAVNTGFGLGWVPEFITGAWEMT